MRTLDRPEDENTAFGAPIKKPPMPEQHRKISEHVRQDPSGKFYTTAPPPPAQHPTIWELFGVHRTTS